MRKSVHTAEYAALRARLVAIRERAGLSQRELARSLGVPHTWVAKVESGERRIDLIEFAWFCAGCAADPAETARQVFAATADKPRSTTPTTPRRTPARGKRGRK